MSGSSSKQAGRDRISSSPAPGDRQGALLRRIAEQLPVVLWTTDENLVFTSSSGGALAPLGMDPDEVVGITLSEFFGSSDPDVPPLRAHQEALAGKSTHFHTKWHGRYFETYIEPFRDEGGEIIGTVGIGYDVTESRRAERERRKLQSQLRQQHKLEVAGNLASGVAHEINNPIQSIMNFAQLIRAGSSAEHLRDYADEIVNEARRVASIVRNLQAFARQDSELPSELQLDSLVARTLSLFRSVMRKENIEVDVDIAEDLPPLWFRGQGLQQIIVNLLTSARDALNDRYPQAHEDKRVWLTARLREPGVGLGEGAFVRLTIEDHGTAIADEDLGTVFEEFKSLPGRDQGIGLGLAISHAIAKENGAYIAVESVEGEYTRFHVDIPLPAP